MKSVGETMAIGRTFKESLQKAIRGLEIGHFGLGAGSRTCGDRAVAPNERNREPLGDLNAERIFYIRYAFKAGMSVDQVYELTNIDRWFLRHLRELVEFESELEAVDRLEQAGMTCCGGRKDGLLRQAAGVVVGRQ